MKLYEYMAVEKPIVATRLRSIEEIAGEDGAFLVAPDDADALAKGIGEAFDGGGARARVEKAFEKIQTHTWGARAWRILAFILSR